jgi:hypothetical protein
MDMEHCASNRGQAASSEDGVANHFPRGCEQHEDEEEDAHRDKVGKLNPAKVQATVRISFWWSFTVMISMLHRVLTNFQQWVEGCVCHVLPNLVLKEHIQ